MPHLFDPKQLSNPFSYRAAVAELDALLALEPDASASHRADELYALIEDYESRHRGAPLGGLP